MSEDPIEKYIVAPVAYPFAFCNPVQADMKALGEKIQEFAEQINPGSGHNYTVTYNGLVIDTGDVYWQHPAWGDRKFYEFNSIGYEIRSAIETLNRNPLTVEDEALCAQARAKPTDAVKHDTRISLHDALILISTAERAYHLIEQGITPDHEDAKYASEGPWDEYLSLWTGVEREARWPGDFHWLQVYVVHGGSEGYYLHVDRIKTIEQDNKYVTEHTHLMLGKSLGATWHQCYASAARIAYMLGA